MDDLELTRRDLVAAGLLGGGALALGSRPAFGARKVRTAAAPITGAAFRHGVASGLPGQQATTLWTRVSGIERSGRLTLEVARDPGFARVVHRQGVNAVGYRDFTARATVDSKRLRPGEEYFYRFATRDAESPVGRFRTLRPPDSRQPLRIGFFSCQAYEGGYYPAHAGLAAEPDLDLVISLGDYIYERAFYERGGPPDRRDRLGANRDGEVQTLGEYRDKYALYRTDRQLQAMHAAHPFVAIWDDHEVEDNYAADRAGDATENPRVAFARRQQAAYLSFFEWMPRFRLPVEPNRTYGRVRLGGLADLLLLDTRQYRDDQACGDRIGTSCPEENAPGRTMLGAAQKAWLKESLAGSRATWKLIGNQVMMMALDLSAGSPLNPDQWDGYAAERRELLDFVLERDVENVAFLTGDIHTFFAGDVYTTGRRDGRRAATEFVGGSITSRGFETFGPPGNAVERGIRAANPHIRFANFRSRGYAVLEARPDELRVEYKGPETVARPNARVRSLGRFRVARGSSRVEVR